MITKPSSKTQKQDRTHRALPRGAQLLGCSGCAISK